MPVKISEVIEACAQAAEAEALEFPPDNGEDEAYMLGIRHCATAIRALAAKYEGCIVAEGEPAGYEHIMDNTEGCEENEPIVELDEYEESPFGRPWIYHSESYLVTNTPLYRAKETK